MIIDAHHHLLNTPGYLQSLVTECKRIGIEKICLFSAGQRAAESGRLFGNREVGLAMKAHINLVIGFACFELGRDDIQKLDNFVSEGFRGLKFINPSRNYDAPEFHAVYERLEREGIPAFFHTGMLGRDQNDKKYDVHNDRHRPIYLDTIARLFPKMIILGAHLGSPWYEEAAMCALRNPNVYFDLSGPLLRWRSTRFIAEILPNERIGWDPQWRHAWEKIIFGSDVPVQKVKAVLANYQRVMAEIDVPQEVMQMVLGGTMRRILGL